MTDSPYATLAGVLQADVTTLREAFFYHASRHQCREGECNAREVLSLARDKISEMLEREMASSSPAPQRSVTFTPLPPELKAKLGQSGGSGSRSGWPVIGGDRDTCETGHGLMLMWSVSTPRLP